MLRSGQNLVTESCEQNETELSKKSCHTAGADFCSVYMNIHCNVWNATLHNHPTYGIYNWSNIVTSSIVQRWAFKWFNIPKEVQHSGIVFSNYSHYFDLIANSKHFSQFLILGVELGLSPCGHSTGVVSVNETLIWIYWPKGQKMREECICISRCFITRTLHQNTPAWSSQQGWDGGTYNTNRQDRNGI